MVNFKFSRNISYLLISVGLIFLGLIISLFYFEKKATFNSPSAFRLAFNSIVGEKSTKKIIGDDKPFNSYKEGQVTDSSYYMDGSITKIQEYEVTFQSKDANHTITIGDETEITCWPSYVDGQNGERIDVSKSWIDFSNTFNKAYLNGEQVRPYSTSKNDIEIGQRIITRYAGISTQPQIIIIGCTE